MSLAWILDIDKNVIEVNNDKNIEFLGQDLVNITLEVGQCVGQPKRYYLVLKMAVSSLESYLLFIILFYPHLMVSTCKVELGEAFSLT